MSMLAERKRKQKWSLNPRGNDWVQDSNKFGQKILEKMGWQHGKGLGAKEDGITEHIKVSYKNDSKGMGYKESNNQWTEHETNFSALLESLSGEKPKEVKLNSLEKKSQSSKARVHYHKFTRGKDLSRYSEKDLANIFGKKSLKESSKTGVTEEKCDTNNEQDSKFLFNAGSMREYFKKKLPGFGKTNGYVIGQNGVLKKADSDSESDTRPSFKFNPDGNEDVSYAGFGFKTEVMSENNEGKPPNGKTTFISYINGDSNEESTEKKHKKKRKSDENGIDNVFSPKKKSRKAADDDKGVSNPAFNPMQTPIKMQKHVLETIEESISEDLSDTEDGVVFIATTVQVHDNTPVEDNTKSAEVEDSYDRNLSKKKSKKSKDLENGIINSVCMVDDPINLTLNGNETSSFEVKRKEKKKRKIQTDGMYENPEILQECAVAPRTEENPYETKVKKSKKQKKTPETVEDISVDLTTDSSEAAFENPGFREDVQKPSNASNTEENPFVVKIKKTKKKKNKIRTSKNLSVDLTTDDSVEEMAYENPNFEDVQETSNTLSFETNPYEVKMKKSKKNKKEKGSLEHNVDLTMDESVEEVVSKNQTKGKKKEKKFALENPGFDSVLDESIDLTEIEENPFEVKTKKKKKALTSVFDNLNFKDSREDSTNTSQNEENPYEVKIVQKKKKKKKSNENYATENPNFNISLEESSCSQIEENPYEVKLKTKRKKDSLAIDNPNFDQNDSLKKEITDKNINDTSTLTSNGLSIEIDENLSLNVEECDLMLNVVATPIVNRVKQNDKESTFSSPVTNSAKRRKSVRFSDVTQERIIPNNDELRNLSDIEHRKELFEINTQVINRNLEEQNVTYDVSALARVSYSDNRLRKRKTSGVDNAAFDKHKTSMEENLDSISKTIDRYEAEIENDMNEKKLEMLTAEDFMIGEVGNPHGEHEKLPEGTKLKFSYANFASRTPSYHLDKMGAKKGYKHLIKGDIVVAFRNANLHEIGGYAVRNKGKV